MATSIKWYSTNTQTNKLLGDMKHNLLKMRDHFVPVTFKNNGKSVCWYSDKNLVSSTLSEVSTWCWIGAVHPATLDRESEMSEQACFNVANVLDLAVDPRSLLGRPSTLVLFASRVKGQKTLSLIGNCSHVLEFSSFVRSFPTEPCDKREKIASHLRISVEFRRFHFLITARASYHFPKTNYHCVLIHSRSHELFR